MNFARFGTSLLLLASAALEFLSFNSLDLVTVLKLRIFRTLYNGKMGGKICVCGFKFVFIKMRIEATFQIRPR